jgi:hypothetical protein
MINSIMNSISLYNDRVYNKGRDIYIFREEV